MEFENKGRGTLPGLQPLPKDVEFAVESAARDIEKEGEEERRRALGEDDTIAVPKSETEKIREELEKELGNAIDEETVEEIKNKLEDLEKQNPAN